MGRSTKRSLKSSAHSASSDQSRSKDSSKTPGVFEQLGDNVMQMSKGWAEKQAKDQDSGRSRSRPEPSERLDQSEEPC